MDKSTKKSLMIMMILVLVIFTLWGLDGWRKYHNKFVYEEHLDDVVLTVDGREITLRELSYYVYDVETKIDKQARIYNPEDPLDYWNTYFNSGTEGGYISEMAKDTVLETCVCDLIYEDMALQSGYELTSEEKEEISRKAEIMYAKLSEKQRQATGLTKELIAEAMCRESLVVKFASEYFENVDFTGYSGYREQLVSYSGEYYKKEILPQHEVEYHNAVVKELSIGRVTTDYVSKY